MDRSAVNESDAIDAASREFRLTFAAALVEKSRSGRAAPLVRQILMKSTAVISSDGSDERDVPSPNAIRQFHQWSEKFR